MLMRHHINEDGFTGDVRYFRSLATGKRLLFGAGTYSIHQHEYLFYLLVHKTGARFFVKDPKPELVEVVREPKRSMYHVHTIPGLNGWSKEADDELKEG